MYLVENATIPELIKMNNLINIRLNKIWKPYPVGCKYGKYYHPSLCKCCYPKTCEFKGDEE